MPWVDESGATNEVSGAIATWTTGGGDDDKEAASTSTQAFV